MRNAPTIDRNPPPHPAPYAATPAHIPRTLQRLPRIIKAMQQMLSMIHFAKHLLNLTLHASVVFDNGIQEHVGKAPHLSQTMNLVEQGYRVDDAVGGVLAYG